MNEYPRKTLHCKHFQFFIIQQEKDSLRSDLKEKEQEILKLRSKVYDLSQKLDEMKKKPKAKGKENSVTL